MNDAPQTPLAPREPAPGEKAAFHCGLWSVLLNALCGCFPVAIPLGVVAIVKHGKAERAALAETEAGRVSGEAYVQDGRMPPPEQVVDAVLAEPGIRSAVNPYAPGSNPFRKGARPSMDGEVTLNPETQHFDRATGRTYPAVIIRGRYRAGSRPLIYARVIPLD